MSCEQSHVNASTVHLPICHRLDGSVVDSQRLKRLCTDLRMNFVQQHSMSKFFFKTLFSCILIQLFPCFCDELFHVLTWTA